MAMTSGTLTSLVLDLVIVAFFVVRQLSTRPLRDNFRLPLILGIIGLVEFVSYLHGKGQQHHQTTIVIALAGSLILAAVTGAVRAPTVRIWSENGQLWRKGTWLTAVLWVVSIAVHLGYDALVTNGKGEQGLGDVTILLYFAVSLTIQRFIMIARADRQPAGQPLPYGYGGTRLVLLARRL
jgi:hypothetical protein